MPTLTLARPDGTSYNLPLDVTARILALAGPDVTPAPAPSPAKPRRGRPPKAATPPAPSTEATSDDTH